MDRNLDLGVMAELLFTEIIMMSFFMPWLWPVKTASETIFSGDLSFCRLLQKPLEYRKSICYSSALIVLLSAGVWYITY